MTSERDLQKYYKNLSSPKLKDSYNALPVLSVENIHPESTFGLNDPEGPSAILKKFVRAALEDPDWVVIPFGTAQYRQRREAGLTVTRNVFGGEDALQKAIKSLGAEQIATAVLESQQPPGYKIGRYYRAIMARTYELIGRSYPSFSFFRGASFDPNSGGYQGSDFYLGWLSGTFRYAKVADYTATRVYPVIVLLRVGDVARAYHENEGSIEYFRPCNERWEAVELPLSSKAKQKYAIVRRLPSDLTSINRFLQGRNLGPKI